MSNVWEYQGGRETEAHGDLVTIMVNVLDLTMYDDHVWTQVR